MPEPADIKEKRIQLLQLRDEAENSRKRKDEEAFSIEHADGPYQRTAKSQALRHEVQELREQISAYYAAAYQSPWPYTFEEAGHVIKLLTPLIGKPDWTGSESQFLQTKVVGWSKLTEAQLTQAIEFMLDNNYRYFNVNQLDRFVIRIPLDCYITSFRSEDPDVWASENALKVARAEARRKINAVVKGLKG